MDWFFSDEGSSGTWWTYSQARKVCGECWIRVECAEWAIHHEGDGFWGGLTPKEREAVRGHRGVSLDRPENHLNYGPRYASA